MWIDQSGSSLGVQIISSYHLPQQVGSALLSPGEASELAGALNLHMQLLKSVRDEGL